MMYIFVSYLFHIYIYIEREREISDVFIYILFLLYMLGPGPGSRATKYGNNMKQYAEICNTHETHVIWAYPLTIQHVFIFLVTYVFILFHMFWKLPFLAYGTYMSPIIPMGGRQCVR